MVYASIAVLLLQLILPTVLKVLLPYVFEDLSELILAALIFIIWIVLIAQKHKSNNFLSQSGFEIPIGLLCLAFGFSLYQSVYFNTSLLVTIRVISQVFYFYILIDLFKDHKKRELFYFCSIGGIFILSVVAIEEYFLPQSRYLHGTDIFAPEILPYRRVGSLLGSPNILAGVYILCLPALWAAYVLVESHKRKLFVLIVLGLSLLAFAMTLSFLCTVNLIFVTVLLTPLIMKEWINKSVGKYFFWGIGACLGSILLLIFLTRHDFSINSRAEYLRAAWHLIKDNPWVGSGADSFRYLSSQWAQGSSFSRYVHNSYLQIWLETGILGLIAIVWLLYTFVKKSWGALILENNHRQRVMIIALIWGLGAFFVDNLTNFTLLTYESSLFWWVTLAAYCSYIKPSVDLPFFKKGIMRIVSLIMAVVFLFLSVSKSVALLKYQEGLWKMDVKEYPVAYDLLEKAKNLDPDNQNIYAAQGFVYLEVSHLTKDMRFLRMAEEKFEEAIGMSPYYYKNYVILSQIALEQKDMVKFKKYMDQVARLYPPRHVSLLKEFQLERIEKEVDSR